MQTLTIAEFTLELLKQIWPMLLLSAALIFCDRVYYILEKASIHAAKAASKVHTIIRQATDNLHRSHNAVILLQSKVDKTI